MDFQYILNKFEFFGANLGYLESGAPMSCEMMFLTLDDKDKDLFIVFLKYAKFIFKGLDSYAVLPAESLQIFRSYRNIPVWQTPNQLKKAIYDMLNLKLNNLEANALLDVVKACELLIKHE